MKFLLVLSFYLGMGQVSYSQNFYAKIVSHHVCNLKKEYRSIRIQVKGPNQCDAIYTKVGKDKRIGGGSFVKSCERIFNSVVKNLKGAGWSCKEALGSGFTIEPLEG